MTERLDTSAYGQALPSPAVKPQKSFIQFYRRQVTAAGVGLMLLAVALTDPALQGTSAGLLLYALGALAIPGAALGRFWCYVYNSGKRDRVVITQGPYSVCRNPIYLCSILAAVGLGLLAQSLLLATAFGVLVTCFYLHIIAGEEAKMSFLHGSTYERYLASTQRMLPALDQLDPGEVERLPGAKLASKLPKLAALGLAFPLVELANRIGVGLWRIF